MVVTLLGMEALRIVAKLKRKLFPQQEISATVMRPSQNHRGSDGRPLDTPPPQRFSHQSVQENGAFHQREYEPPNNGAARSNTRL